MKSVNLSVALVLSLVSAGSMAQEKASLDVGGLDFVPTLDVSLQHDSNVTRSNSAVISSWISLYRPELRLEKNSDITQVSVGVSASKGIYHSSQNDNFDDYQIFVDLGFEFDRRNQLAAGFVSESGHDARGTAYSIGIGNTLLGPDKYKRTTLDTKYSYGAQTAPARFEATVRLRNINYDNDVINGRPRDRSEQSLGGIFYYQVAPATDLVLDSRYTNTSYDSITMTDPNFVSLDSKTTNLLAGLKWESTAATTGFAKLGYQKRSFDNDLREGFSGLKWEAGVVWSPIERALIEFSTANDTLETNGLGSFIKRKDYRLDWRHQWLERLSTSSAVAYGSDIYVGGLIPRQDKSTQLDLTASYQFRRWISFIAAYSYIKRNSDVVDGSFDFDKNLFSLSAKLSL
ncbi:MAG: outer membrane beta-barrel protein [Paraglaciecola sp.]|nr:outer membrane beta-barrel protein [Paraglaciecola sp.]NCT46738.1 outer membrane beta-barrel protein [Paraglaciecola sp.]